VGKWLVDGKVNNEHPLQKRYTSNGKMNDPLRKC